MTTRKFKTVSPELLIAARHRFEKFIDRSDQCWLWMGAVKDNGYGYFRISRTAGMIGAHKFSWLLYKGKITPPLYVCHSCDNRRCVNPAHLWLGTHTDNQRDMAAKGRVYSHAAHHQVPRDLGGRFITGEPS